MEFKTVDGYKIFRNPNTEELIYTSHNGVNGANQVRGFLLGNDVFIWPGDLMNHRQMAHHLKGIPNTTFDCYVTNSRCEIGVVDSETHEDLDDAYEQLMKNPKIRSMLPSHTTRRHQSGRWRTVMSDPRFNTSPKYSSSLNYDESFKEFMEWRELWDNFVDTKFVGEFEGLASDFQCWLRHYGVGIDELDADRIERYFKEWSRSGRRGKWCDTIDRKRRKEFSPGKFWGGSPSTVFLNKNFVQGWRGVNPRRPGGEISK